MKELHEQIKAIRKAKGLTQEAVANVIGIKKANLSRIENGDIKLSEDKLERLAAFFKMTIEEIATFESVHDKVKKGRRKDEFEDLLEEKEKQIKRMQRNTEEFITELLKYFQEQINEGKKAGLDLGEKSDAAFEALCKVKGIMHLFNQENLRSDFKLLEPFHEYRKQHLEYDMSMLLKMLEIAIAPDKPKQ